jgi:hypothetical protein
MPSGVISHGQETQLATDGMPLFHLSLTVNLALVFHLESVHPLPIIRLISPALSSLSKRISTVSP